MMPFWPWWMIPIRAEELKELQEKAEKLPIYMKQFRHMTEHALELEDKLEAVREFVLSRKYDIEMDIENFGMLKPVLSYFLEEADG